MKRNEAAAIVYGGIRRMDQTLSQGVCNFLDARRVRTRAEHYAEWSSMLSKDSSLMEVYAAQACTIVNNLNEIELAELIEMLEAKK